MVWTGRQSSGDPSSRQKLQIADCGLSIAQKAFGDRAPPADSLQELLALPRPSSRYKGEKREERIGNSREGRKGREGNDAKE